MRPRLATGVGAAILLTAAVAATAPQAREAQGGGGAGGSELAVAVRQLPAEGGVIPVELRCEPARLISPNSIEPRLCFLKNNTNKLIAAVALAYSITTEKNGKEATGISYLTAETLVHPDLRADRLDNRVGPGRELPIRDSATTYEDDAVVKGIEVWIDYVEFDDQTAAGPNRVGSRIVSDIRAGAAKYKAWLVDKYRQSGNSVAAVVPLLDTHLRREELGIRSGEEEHGAIAYQNHARRLTREKGPQGLDRFLKLAGDRKN